MNRRLLTIAACLGVTWLSSAPSALAACAVVGDSVAVGVAQAMRECGHSARVGLSSTAAASQAPRGKTVIASIGSNDFPRGISERQRQMSDSRVRAALSHAYRNSGGKLILILPSNEARATVASWAAAHGVRTVDYAAGRDGVHPRDYRDVARRVRGAMGE